MNSDCDGNIDAKRTKDMLADMIAKGEAMNCPICQVLYFLLLLKSMLVS